MKRRKLCEYSLIKRATVRRVFCFHEIIIFFRLPVPLELKKKKKIFVNVNQTMHL